MNHSAVRQYLDDEKHRIWELRPYCDVCGRRVERIGFERQSQEDLFRFTVYCHGQQETAEIPRVDFQFPKGNMEPGRAFVRPRLEETKRLEWKMSEEPNPGKQRSLTEIIDELGPALVSWARTAPRGEIGAVVAALRCLADELSLRLEGPTSAAASPTAANAASESRTQDE